MTERLFLCCLPDDAARARIARIATDLGPRLGESRRAVGSVKYHLTLHFLGAYPVVPGDRVTAAVWALARIDASPFELTLDEAMSFPRSHRRPCVLRPSSVPKALQECWQSAGESLSDAGFGARLSTDYTPHITMFYANAGLDAPVPVEPVRIEAQELWLMHSVTGEEEYRVVGRRKLST